MRFLQIVSSANMTPAGPPDPEHMAKVNKAIHESIASGELIATGALGKRATSAARVSKQGGEISVEDPPKGDGWMAGGGYSLIEAASKEEAIAKAKHKLEIMGDGIVELIQVSEMHPPPSRAPQSVGGQPLPAGVIPYLSFDDASKVSAFYQLAFGAREIARMPGEDGKRLMHCHLEINCGALMLSDNFAEMGMAPVQRSDSYTMSLIVADGDAWWNRASRAGCKPKMPFELAPWGDKYGQLLDPFGVTWAINSPPQR